MPNPSNFRFLSTESDYCDGSTESQLATDLQNVDLIISDDVLMCHRYNIDALDRKMAHLFEIRILLVGNIKMFYGDI